MRAGSGERSVLRHQQGGRSLPLGSKIEGQQVENPAGRQKGCKEREDLERDECFFAGERSPLLEAVLHAAEKKRKRPAHLQGGKGKGGDEGKYSVTASKQNSKGRRLIKTGRGSQACYEG